MVNFIRFCSINFVLCSVWLGDTVDNFLQKIPSIVVAN